MKVIKSIKVKKKKENISVLVINLQYHAVNQPFSLTKRLANRKRYAKHANN